MQAETHIGQNAKAYVPGSSVWTDEPCTKRVYVIFSVNKSEHLGIEIHDWLISPQFFNTVNDSYVLHCA